MVDDVRVSFIILSAQDEDGTALFDDLSSKSDLSIQRDKAAAFFVDDARDWTAPDYSVYHANFPAFSGRPRGAAAPSCLYWPESLERMAAYNPALKLIVILRDPVQRAWSHWTRACARGVEAQPFAWCIRQGRQRLFDAKPWGFDQETSYVERGFYGEQVTRLYGLFPRGQTLVLQAEDLSVNPGAVFARVRLFLGLAPRAATAVGKARLNRALIVAADPTAADIAHLRVVYAPDLERLAGLTGIRFY